MLIFRRLCLSFLLQHILNQIQLRQPSLDTCLELPVSLCHLFKQPGGGLCFKSDVLSDATCDDPPNTAALGQKPKPPDPPENMRGKARPVPKAGTGQVSALVPQARTTHLPSAQPTIAQSPTQRVQLSSAHSSSPREVFLEMFGVKESYGDQQGPGTTAASGVVLEAGVGTL